MKAKFISPFLLLAHITVALIYLVLANLTGIKYPILYFGGEAFFFATSLLAATGAKLWIHKQFIYIHVCFVITRGIIYVLNDSEILIIGSVERLLIVCVFSALFVIPFFIKNYLNGYFNEN